MEGRSTFLREWERVVERVILMGKKGVTKDKAYEEKVEENRRDRRNR